MVGQIDVILHLVELGVVDQLSGVLLSVKRLLLQSGVQLAESQGAGVGAQSCPDCQMDLVLHDADLQALQVGQGVDLLVGGQLTEAVLEVAQALQTGALQGVQQSLTGVAVQSSIHGLAVREQEGGLESIQRGNEGGDVSSGRTAHGDVALGRGLSVLTVAAQLLVGIQVHGDGTAGTILNQFLELQETFVFRGVFRSAVGCDDVEGVVAFAVAVSAAGVGSVGAAAASQHGSHHQGCHDQCKMLLHFFVLLK